MNTEPDLFEAMRVLAPLSRQRVVLALSAGPASRDALAGMVGRGIRGLRADLDQLVVSRLIERIATPTGEQYALTPWLIAGWNDRRPVFSLRTTRGSIEVTLPLGAIAPPD